GIGWHEARVPTIATSVPRRAFTWVTKKLMGEVSIPIITSNRINTPQVGEEVLADGCADMVSMARPFLADADLVLKAIENRSDEINTCIACNQACLDHTFTMQVCSCIVNPRACHETELNFHPTSNKKRIAVVGAGPAGMAASTVLAERGHHVDLFEADDKIGGQFNMAAAVPGKEEYAQTIRYYNTMIKKHGVHLHLSHRVSADELKGGNYDEIILATGVTPRQVNIEGIDHPMVLNYAEVLHDKKPVGKRVAIVGAGGIGFDMAEYLTHNHDTVAPSLNVPAYMEEWGVDMNYERAGALTKPAPTPEAREIYLLKRSKGKHGKNLGKTTGWIHRASLAMKNVKNIGRVAYDRIDDHGLTITVDGEQQTLAVDNVIICAGQEPLRDLFDDLVKAGKSVHLVGGSDIAAELDAKRAIKDASYLAAKL
ncbi:MAG: FAD-dependent oxidoreductase, partial [Saprospiraceae bacterium]